MASLVVHFIVGIIFWPIAVPFGAFLGLLYSFYPISLINAFLRFGGYIALPGFTTGKVTVKGLDFSYIDRNPSAGKESNNRYPTVVFVHGLTSQKLSWAPVIRALPKSWRIIAIDLPGHGQSGFIENQSYCVVDVGELLHELFLSLNLKDFHLVGESVGAAYVGQYTFAHPELVSSTTLLCPPGGHRLGAQATPAMEALERIGRGSTEKNPLLPETAADFRAMLELVLYDPSQLSFHDKMLEALVHVQSRHYPYIKKVLRDVVNGGETDEVIRARASSNIVPGILLCGRDDQICHVSGAKIAKRLSPNSKVYILNNCGHCISMEKPGKTANLITEFINSHSSRQTISSS